MNTRAGHEWIRGWPGSVPVGILGPKSHTQIHEDFSHGSPRAMGQKPTGPQVPMGIPVSIIKKWMNSYIISQYLQVKIKWLSAINFNSVYSKFIDCLLIFHLFFMCYEFPSLSGYSLSFSLIFLNMLPRFLFHLFLFFTLLSFHPVLLASLISDSFTSCSLSLTHGHFSWLIPYLWLILIRPMIYS